MAEENLPAHTQHSEDKSLGQFSNQVRSLAKARQQARFSVKFLGDERLLLTIAPGDIADNRGH